MVPRAHALHWGWWNPVVGVPAWRAGGIWPLPPKVAVVVSLQMYTSHKSGRGMQSEALAGEHDSALLTRTDTMWFGACTSANEVVAHTSVRNIADFQERGDVVSCLCPWRVTLAWQPG